jgi:hypothetical protein
MRVVIPDLLYCGNELELNRPTELLAAGIEAIVAVAPLKVPEQWPRDLVLVRIPLADDASNSVSRLELAISTVVQLLRGDQRTFVACSAGLSRSVAVGAAARARVERRSPVEVLGELSQSGAMDVSPGLWATIDTLESARLG